MEYQDQSIEGRLLSEDPEALGQVGRWVTEVLTSTSYWDLRSEWPDLHQEIIASIIDSLRRGLFDPSKDLKAYVHAVARYTAMRSRSSQRRFFLIGATGNPEPQPPPRAEDALFSSQLVRRVLESVGEECRQMIRAYFLEDLSYAEIAAARGLPVGTVKSRLFRCLKKAQALLPRGRRPSLLNGSLT